MNPMERLIAVQSKQDIPSEYQDTPVGLLFEYHNFGRTKDVYTNAQLLIGMCMDNRKCLNIPPHFAFILRTGGVNLRYSGFKVSYAIAVGGVRQVVLIGHTQCGMVNLESKREQFVKGLVEGAGWDVKVAEEHFAKFFPMFEIGNEIDFILSEAKRLKITYPKIDIVPLMYRIEDNLLYQIKESA